MTTLDELLDQAAINDLLDEYADAIDARDFERVEAVFTDDAHLDYSSAGGLSGPRNEVIGWLRESLPAVTLTQHLLTNRRVRVDGDTATATTQLFNPLLFSGDETTQLLLLGGLYDDALTRTPDGWRITDRVHRTIWTAGPFPAQLNAPEA